jgi:hypothetical protein
VLRLLLVRRNIIGQTGSFAKIFVRGTNVDHLTQIGSNKKKKAQQVTLKK